MAAPGGPVMHQVFGVALVLVGFVQTPARAQPSSMSRPAQIILIRHAEKPTDPANPHLSPAGVEHHKRLVSFIKTDSAMARFGLPIAVFATKTTADDNGQRTQETVAPLAAAAQAARADALPRKGLCGLGQADSFEPSVRRKDRRHLLEP